RHGRHFDLLRRDQDPVIDNVPGDGDCFFSCISKALGKTDIAASNLALRQELADHLWNRPDALQVIAAFDGPLEEQHAGDMPNRSGQYPAHLPKDWMKSPPSART